MERELSKQELDHFIGDLLKEQSLCVIPACADNEPRASTEEYFPRATTIYMPIEEWVKTEILGTVS